MSDFYLAFLDVVNMEVGAAYRGGCLITDLDTNPHEFRCTASIRPTELQRILYGKKLIEYICKDLVGLPMLEKMKIKPNVVLVRMSEFLRIRPGIEIPVVMVEKKPDGLKLVPHPSYKEEVNLIYERLKKIEDPFEPFARVQGALQEAHRLKVGD